MDIKEARDRLEIKKLRAEIKDLQLDRALKRSEYRWWRRPHIIALVIPTLMLITNIVFSSVVTTSKLLSDRNELEKDRLKLEREQSQHERKVAAHILAISSDELNRVRNDRDQMKSQLEGHRDNLDAIQVKSDNIAQKLANSQAALHDITRKTYEIIEYIEQVDLADPESIVSLEDAIQERATRLRGIYFGRREQEVSFGDEARVWRLSFDVRPSYSGRRPAPHAFLGSCSLRGGSNPFCFIALMQWSNQSVATKWDAAAVWFDQAGEQKTERLPDSRFHKLELNRWYRWSWTLDLASGQVLRIELTDVESASTAVHAPVDRFLMLDGMPTHFRNFVADQSDATAIVFANMNLEPVAADGSSTSIGRNRRAEPGEAKDRASSGGDD